MILPLDQDLMIDREGLRALLNSVKDINVIGEEKNQTTDRGTGPETLPHDGYQGHHDAAPRWTGGSSTSAS